VLSRWRGTSDCYWQEGLYVYLPKQRQPEREHSVLRLQRDLNLHLPAQCPLALPPLMCKLPLIYDLTLPVMAYHL